MEIGKRIIELRKQNRWTQAQLAEKLHVTDKAVSKWEQELGFPELSTVVRLSETFDVSTDYLLIGKEFEKKKKYTVERNTAMNTGDIINARTHAEFLNILIGRNYRGYMKCTHNLGCNNVIWMIRLDGQVTKAGWRNSLEQAGDVIVEEYVGNPADKMKGHCSYPMYQTRYVFDISEDLKGRRSYIFRGAFTLSTATVNNERRVWEKTQETVNFAGLI